MAEALLIPHQVKLEAHQWNGLTDEYDINVEDYNEIVDWAKEHGGYRVLGKEKAGDPWKLILEMEGYELIINPGDWLIHTLQGMIKMTNEEKERNYVEVR